MTTVTTTTAGGRPASHTEEPAMLTAPATTAPALADEHADAYTAAVTAAEASLHANGVPVGEVLRRVAGRPDGSLDPERVARLAVAALLLLDRHEDDHDDDVSGRLAERHYAQHAADPDL
jgi:hypothetical protein